jgi:phage gp29-like protein
MNIFKKIFQSKNSETFAVKKDRVSFRLKRYNPVRIDLEMARLKLAVQQAQNVDNPNRLNLYAIYAETLKEAHLLSQVRTAHYTVQQSKFTIVDAAENERPELHNLFEANWFTDFLTHALNAEFWGFSLIEFGTLENGEFKDITLIPRQNVLQEFDTVKIDPMDTKGIVYTDNATKLFLLPIGDKYDLGLLEVAAKEVISKNYSRTDWGRASEKFGMPLIAIRTDASNPKELDQMEEMAANFGSNGYVILNKDDEIEIKTMSAGESFYKIYKDNADFCDNQISKLINGQTMTSDDGSSYSQANVHERILNNYTRSRLHRLQNIINTQLFPFLIFHGYNLTGAQFRFTDIVNWFADLPEQTVQQASTLALKKNSLHRNIRKLYKT